ncbi:MAG: PQQ-binding-like beta-propeller repeat protein [Thermofilaceae archaeon]
MGNEGSTRSSSSPTPCRPQVAYESEIPTSQIVLVEDGVIFSFDPDGRSGDAYALNETTGKILWRTNIYSSFYRFITRSALGRYYYVGTTGSESNPSLLIALDKRTGRIIWTSEIERGGISELIVCNNTVYVGTRSGLVSRIDENGKIVWKKNLRE